METLIKRIAWSADLDRKMSRHFDNLALLRRDVLTGKAEAYDIDSELVIIVRPELSLDGGAHELVWLASFGKNLNKHVPAVLAQAKAKGFASVRYHCDLASESRVVRLVKRHGATHIESVYTVDLGGKRGQ